MFHLVNARTPRFSSRLASHAGASLFFDLVFVALAIGLYLAADGGHRGFVLALACALPLGLAAGASGGLLLLYAQIRWDRYGDPSTRSRSGVRGGEERRLGAVGVGESKDD